MMEACNAATYPVRGLALFLCCLQPELWGIALCPMILCLSFVLLFGTLLVVLTLGPQTMLLVGVCGPFAPIVAVILVLIELVMVVQLLVTICLTRAQDAIFDAVHAANSPLRTLSGGPVPADEIQANHSWMTAIMFSLWRLFIMFIALPLNLIPFVGTVLYAALCGYYLAWDLHSTWMSSSQNLGSFESQKEWCRQRQGQYVAFGGVCQLLEFVPVVNVLCFFSNAAGAALWAAHLDEQTMQQPLLEGGEVAMEPSA